MPTINPAKVDQGNGWVLFEWTDVSEADDFAELDLSGFANFIAEFSMNGTAGGMTTTIAGGYVSGETFPTLQDQGGNDITFAAAGQSLCATSPLFVKPTRSGGTSAAHDIRALIRHDRR